MSALFAAITLGTVVQIIIGVIVLIIVVGILNYIITNAPPSLLPEPYKSWIRYLLLVLVCIVIIRALLHYTGIYSF